MRLLFLSPVHPLLTPGNPLPKWQMQASWVRALEKVGAEVEVVRYTPEDRIRLGWVDRVWWNFKVVVEVVKINRQIDKSSNRQIDKLIIYSLGADVLLPWTIRLIKWLIKAPLVVLSGVSPVSDGNPRERSMAKLADFTAVNDERQADEWMELGAKKAVILPISAMDPELHFNKGPALKDIDVLFVGTLTPERKEFFGSLKKLLPESISFVVKEFVWEKEYAGLMSRAKIVLNPIRPEMAEGANLRMFEIPAFGALELGSYGRNEWLTPGKEMLVYKDAEEAAGLINEFLKDDKRREEMVKKGKKRVMEEHTFEDRAEKLIEMVNGLMDS
ncbi:glycosyltransferase family 1 protein [Candidatus Collierbacteria bacterium]|nr:glycosyltransferase family 1 protein [Candidatus Collierbacteria bacterium]